MELPPDSMVRALLARYARLIARLGEEIGPRPLVLPTSSFFPDRFEGDAKSASRLVRRMREHAGMSDVPIKTRILGVEPGVGGGACSSGSCSTGAYKAPSDEPQPRVVDRGDYWRVQIPEPELGHPTVLTTSIARSLGAVLLMDTRAEGEAIEEPFEVTIDVAAVALGFGPLLLQGSYIYSKSCGGPSVAQATRLSCPELAVLTAFFAAANGHSLKAVAKHLDTTQAALFQEARELAESNPKLVARLRDEPETLDDDSIQLEDVRPWLSRALGLGGKKKARSGDLPDDISVTDLETLLASTPKAPARSRPKDPKHDELQALVAEALDEARADSR